MNAIILLMYNHPVGVALVDSESPSKEDNHAAITLLLETKFKATDITFRKQGEAGHYVSCLFEGGQRREGLDVTHVLSCVTLPKAQS